ncbi:MAG: acyltransferase [Desulfobacteraceae bacterium]|nr:acyltransferase [Desulfobacteraceae bacterium]
MKKEINSIFIAKAVAISLVVAGHYSPPHVPDYWMELRGIIYAFHMPLFFVLAGYLFGMAPHSDYSELLKKKFDRLVVPFLSASVFFVVVKYVVGIQFSLLYPVNLQSIAYAFIYPIRSYVSPLWFLYALILIFVLFPVLSRVCKDNPYLLLAAALILYSFEWTEAFCIAQVFHHLPVFTLGYVLGLSRIDLDSSVSRPAALTGFFLAALAFAALYLVRHSYPALTFNKAMMLLLSLSGSAACIFLSVALSLSQSRIKDFVIPVGVYSMSIYLFHTVFTSALRIGFNDVLHIPESAFPLAALTSVAAGIVFPLLLEKHWLRRNRFTRRFILGLR